MKNKRWASAAHLLIIVLLLLVLVSACLSGGRSRTSTLALSAFRGEYSQDGGDWLPLEKTTRLSALEGNLVLRGSFDQALPEDWVVYFYSDHITYSVYINGECAAVSDPASCARTWGHFISEGITPEDTVEIRLSNPHRFGNATAYNNFLNSLYYGPNAQAERALKDRLGAECIPYRAAGVLILILSIGILGTALAFSLLRVSVNRQLWAFGLMSLGMGGYIALDTVDVSLWSGFAAFNTCAQQLCMMLAALELGVFLAEYLSAGSKKAARIVAALEGVFLAVLALLCLTRQILLYDTLPLWALAQLIACPALLACCVCEWRRTRQKRPAVLLSCGLLLITIMLDLVNTALLWWPEGLVTKLVFIPLFLFHLARGIWRIPVSYQKAVQADKLEDDLKNSRIISAMNQIRTHFIFNILNAISGMCKYDPEKADQTVVRFARYLRTNIDIMQDDQPITFHSALRHVEDYVALEQIRFGDKIQFVTEITEEDFLLPPLILQPIVENAIKHGLTPKPSGGTVILRTWAEEADIRISIRDDGVGFDPEAPVSDQSVGLKNVRFRLQRMMRGRLELRSAPGCGTTATISIPREEAEKCM